VCTCSRACRHRTLQSDKSNAGAEKRRKEKAHARMEDNLNNLEGEREEEEDALEGLVDKEKRRQAKIARLQGELGETQHQIQREEGSSADNGDVKEQKKQNYRLMQKNTKDFNTLKTRQNGIKGTIKSLGREVNSINAEIEEANNAMRRKLGALSAGPGSQQLRSAHLWVQQNQDQFKKPVYGPLGLYVDVTDPQHARYLETCVGWKLRKAFVVQCQQDNDTLLRELKDNGRFKGAWVINYDAPAGGQNTHQPRVPKQQLTELGVTHYMAELIDAPAVVKAVLCDNANLHNIAFGTLEAERRSEEVLLRGVQMLVTKNKVNRGSKSVHSGRMVSQISYVQTQAKLFGMAVDRSRVEALKQQADDKDRQVGVAMDEFDASKTAFAALQNEQKQLEQERKRLADMGNALTKLKQLLRSKQATLDRVHAEPSIDQQRKVLEKKIERLRQKETKGVPPASRHVGDVAALVTLCCHPVECASGRGLCRRGRAGKARGFHEGLDGGSHPP
jgi:chromosome segregation ATPase